MRRSRILVSMAAATVLAACGDTEMGVRSRDATDRPGGATATTVATTPAPTTAAPTTRPSTTTPSTTRATTTAPPTSTTLVDTGAELTVLDAGAEPRQVLRFRLEPGQVIEQTTVLGQDLTLELFGEEQDLSTESTMVTRSTVQSVEDGRATIEVTYVEVSSGDPATDDALQDIAGITTVIVVDDRGRILSSETDLDSVSSPDTRLLLESLLPTMARSAFVWPEEAVGVGATWRSEADFGAGGIPITGTQEVTITAIDGDVVTYELGGTFEQTGGDFEFPGMPPDVAIDDFTVNGRVSGSATVSLLMLYPDGLSESDVTMNLTASDESDGVSMKLRIVQRIDTTVRSG